METLIDTEQSRVTDPLSTPRYPLIRVVEPPPKREQLSDRFTDEEEVTNEVLRLGQGSSQEDLAETLATALRIHREQENPPQITEDGPTYVFLVHPRDFEEEEGAPRDIVTLLPALERASIKDTCIFFERLSPGGMICPYTSEDGGVVGALNYAAITIPELKKRGYFTDNGTEAIRYARPRILEAVMHSINMGAKVIALGEMFGKMTRHGKYLEEALIEKLGREEAEKITILTGHDMTVVLMIETMKRMVKEITGRDLAEVLNEKTLGILGCGSIGGSFAQALAAKHGLKKVVLCDTTKGVAESLARKLRDQNPDRDMEILIETDPEKAFRKARVWATAASVPKAVITNPKWLRPGTMIVDDGEPKNVSPEVAHSPRIAVAEPLAKPIAFRIFRTGLVRKGKVNDASYGCELQAALAQVLIEKGEALTNYPSMGPGRVTPERVAEMYHLIELSDIDFQLAPFQRHGKLLTEEDLVAVAGYW